MDGGYAVIEKEFQKDDQIQVCLTMETLASYWYHNSLAVEREPLVYGLEIEERWQAVKEVTGVKDYFIYPESEWNYPPVRLKVADRTLEEWTMDGGNTKELPYSPVAAAGEEAIISLIPFGCTRLRVSQFPFYEK